MLSNMEYIWKVMCDGWWIIAIMAVVYTVGRYLILPDDTEYEDLNRYYKIMTDELEDDKKES